MKYIKLENGNLYAYNDQGITAVLNKDKWGPSSLTYLTVLYSKRSDYVELDEEAVLNEYGKDLVNRCYDCFDKIKKLFS